MSFENIRELQESVVRCAIECPFRSNAAGCYPKPPKGPPTSKVMMIFENPGSPAGKNLAAEGNPEMAYNSSNINIEEALRLATDGQRQWLFRRLGFSSEKWVSAGVEVGKTVYTTDSHKCPNPTNKAHATAKSKEKARQHCQTYLKEEIRLVQPKVIIGFGDYARKSIADLENAVWDGGIKSIPKENRIKVLGKRMYALLPHPDGLWRNPTMSREAFDDAMYFVFSAASNF